VATRSALKAGAIGIFLGTIPLVGILLTGWLAVYFYKRQKGAAPRTTRGAQLGGAAGVVVSAINAVFTIAIIVSHAQQQCVDKFVEVAQKLGINTQTPEFQASMSGLFTPSGIVSSFVVALVLASIGGAMAAILLRRPPRA
jgi:ABC-type antimicrobial peptide transport system permease subunit